MIIELINKILMTLFFMSSLNVLRHIFYFVQFFVQPVNDDQINKYKISPKSLLLLGISLGYILTVIFSGIGI